MKSKNFSRITGLVGRTISDDALLKVNALSRISEFGKSMDFEKTSVAKDGYFVSWKDALNKNHVGVVVDDKSEILGVGTYSTIIAHSQAGVFRYQTLEDLERFNGKDNFRYYRSSILKRFD
ncbi:MAG: hypothetical protein PF542_06895 [Nanoarchaeota archaeon]|jgi:hypothetical protein|nr:hypothetical protein [Nanoarchaeota archaeon]